MTGTAGVESDKSGGASAARAGFEGIVEIHHQEEVQERFFTGLHALHIGRDPENEIVLEGSKVSRRHARLEWQAGGPALVDLGSANGTRLNGSALAAETPQPVRAGDRAELGGFTLVFKALRSQEGGEAGAQPAAEAAPEAATLLVERPAPAAAPAANAPRLVIRTSQGEREVSLGGKPLLLGRDPGSDIQIDDPTVSRRHARLEPAREGALAGYEIVDLGSANGLTGPNGKISRKLLENGEVIWLSGEVSIQFRGPAAQAGAPRAAPAPAREPAPPPAPEAPEIRKLDMRQRAALSIGRGAENDLKLSHPTVSRRHARITRSGSAYHIEDLRSSNGTFVNGERLEPGRAAALSVGDVIYVGPFRFVFVPDAFGAVDESANLRLDALHLNQRVGKGVNLLSDLSLSIHPREFVAIVGVSGAGKSTLLNALTGFRPASDGQVLVNGENLYRSFDAYRTNLGYVPQDDIIHKELTPWRALDYAAQLRLPADTSADERRKAVQEELETLGLAERKDVPISRLSGGQRKRVSIGVERLTRPGLFFLDEATSGLDPGTESQMMRLLRRLADEGQTIFLVTHATKNVMLCDKVIFLHKGGRLAYFGPPGEALEYFEVQDFDEIYEKLQNEGDPAGWEARFRGSEHYVKYVVDPLQERYGKLLDTSRPAPEPAAPAPARKRPPRQRQISGFRQFLVLSARYLNIIRSDRINLLLLFLIAPVLGSMDLIAWPKDIYDPVNGDAARAMVMLFLGAIIPFLVGALSTVREIVKEKAVYERERTVTLKILPYLLSKVWVALLFALYHAGALLAIKLLAVDFSHLELEDILLFYGVLVLAVMSGVLWGLLISAIAPREEQAMLLVIVVVVVQMVFSGGILPLDQLGQVGEVLGSATSSKWTFQAMVDVTQVKSGDCSSESDLSACRLPGIQSYETEPERRVLLEHLEERYGEALNGEVEESAAWLGGILVALFVILAVLQKRKDVI